MNNGDVDLDELMKRLADNFNILADEVQLLSDRKTILEHKLRFAHEQYQHLADRYAPSDPEISSILAKLQLPSELTLPSPDRTTFVPLPPRRPSGSKQQTAEAIRDGRRASNRLASLRGWRTVSEAGERSSLRAIDSVRRASQLGTSIKAPFEQDFTVPGKQSQLLCPFAKMEYSPSSTGIENTGLNSGSTSDRPNTILDPKSTLHDPKADPICATLWSEINSSPPPSVTSSVAKCPIRFLNQHSPEEVAKYFEIHKHEIPRSHEVCVKRYQRNEEDIRKLDAKYGNLVSMIEGLGQKHQPMLQVKEEEQVDCDDRRSNERVKSWAKVVSADGTGEFDIHISDVGDCEDREGRFDRPMKEIRVGESPSRPWGISVPYVDPPDAQGPVAELPQELADPVYATTSAQVPETSRKCPFPHGQKPAETKISSPKVKPIVSDAAVGGQNDQGGRRSQPVFIHSSELNKISGTSRPQMIFTGPVFIGYPVEQAMALMQQWQTGMNTDKP